MNLIKSMIDMRLSNLHIKTLIFTKFNYKYISQLAYSREIFTN